MIRKVDWKWSFDRNGNFPFGEVVVSVHSEAQLKRVLALLKLANPPEKAGPKGGGA